MPARVGKDDFEKEVLASEIPVLADFYSDSCIPCKRMSPILSQLENEYAGRIKIVKINTNFEKELVEKYEVMAAPTLVFFKNGSETGRIRGAAGKDEIIKHIDELQ
ncbi:MAG: thioredoxin family protein [Oscillospiraceae bacterium]|nr:thioredoxin family protein [Oscillospiraceae bacterium]